MIHRKLFILSIVTFLLSISLSHAQQDIFVRDVDWNSDSTHILQAFNTGIIEVVEVESGTVIQNIEFEGVFRAMLWHPLDPERFAIAIDNFIIYKPTITIYHALTGEILATHEFEGSSMPSSFISSMAWNPDGTLLAIGMDFVTAPNLNRDIEVIDADTGRTINHIITGLYGSTYIDWSPDGEQLVSTTTDGKITIWRALRPESLYTHADYQANITTWSPDGDWLVAVSQEADSDIQIWNVPRGQLSVSILGIDVSAIDWHPDSTFFATANSGNHVTIWRVLSGTIFSEMTFDTDIYALAWSPDGTKLALGTIGETIIIELVNM